MRFRRHAGAAATAAIVLPLMLLIGACAGDGRTAPVAVQPAREPEPGIVHVHGLGINPADGVLYAATHTGLFRIPQSGAAERIGDRHQDMMGFTVVGPDHFLASGHPDMRDYRAGRLPALLGLIESGDGGRTWRSRSLSGTADFHVLRVAHGRVYGFNSAGNALMVSADGTSWESRAALLIRDFAVSPVDPDRIVAATAQDVQRSEDGGRTWERLAAPPLVLLAWGEDDALWGVTAGGVTYRSADSGAGWQAVGSLGGPPEALLANGGTLYAAVHESGIYRSDDGGVTWHLYYRNPT
jgi:photosystem II stability/assembly factor-like uncharacterized protein